MRLKGHVNGLSYDNHGGGCCGILHLSNFPLNLDASVPERVRWLYSAIEDAMLSEFELIDEDAELSSPSHLKNWNCAIEVVLTDAQIVDWGLPLLLVGFVQVHRFRNSNSGNNCTVFYYNTGK